MRRRLGEGLEQRHQRVRLRGNLTGATAVIPAGMPAWTAVLEQEQQAFPMEESAAPTVGQQATRLVGEVDRLAPPVMKQAARPEVQVVVRPLVELDRASQVAEVTARPVVEVAARQVVEVVVRTTVEVKILASPAAEKAVAGWPASPVAF